MDSPQLKLCTRKTEIALEVKLHLDVLRVYMAMATIRISPLSVTMIVPTEGTGNGSESHHAA